MRVRAPILVALGALLVGACRAPTPDAAPATQVDAPWHEAESAAGTWRVRWRCEPDSPQFLELGRILIEAVRADGAAATDLRADAGMPQHGHGLLRHMRVEPLGEGRFAVENVYLHMPGAWRVYLDLGREGVFERLELELEVD